MQFSVLMSIYYKEHPKYLSAALSSIWANQTIIPSEIILVQDGPLGQELLEIIKRWETEVGKRFIVISLDKNVGLGDALNIGLQRCSYDIVARMDTDDIAFSTRFEKQLNVLENSTIDLVGSWVSEFDNDISNIVAYRKVPETQEAILKFSKERTPVTHPTVMFRKKAVIEVGGYKSMLWFEDYYLWVRMLQNGSQFYNLQESLLYMRAGFNQLQRRSGFQYIKREIAFQIKLYRINYISFLQVLKNIMIRSVVRILPKTLIRQVYMEIRK